MAIFSSMILLVFSLAAAIVAIAAWSTIFKKAGFSSWYWILMIIPIVNIVWFLIFAFGKWPTSSNTQSSTPSQPTTVDLPPSSGAVN